MDTPPPYVIQVDPLYFRAREGGVAYATEGGKVLNPQFHPHLGIRALLGVILPHDSFHLWLQGLHFHARTRSSKEGVLIPTWGSLPFTPSSFSMWRLHLGLFDLGLSRRWIVSPYLILTPFWGFRYAEIRHKLKVNYEMTNPFCMKNKFWGVGPFFGGEFLWKWNRWASLFLRGNLNLSLGKTYLHQDEMREGLENNLFDTYQAVRAIAHGAIGFDFPFSKSIHFRTAWESYLFLGQNQVMDFIDSRMPGKFLSKQGNLSLSGISFGIGF